MKNVTEKDLEYYASGTGEEPVHDVPGFIDGFLHGMKNSFMQLGLFAEKTIKTAPSWALPSMEDAPLSDPVFEPKLANRDEVEYDAGVQERIEAIDDEERRSAFKWVRTTGEFERQAEYLDSKAIEMPGWKATTGEILGELANPVNLLEFGAIGKAVGFAAKGAKALAPFMARTLGNPSFKFVEITKNLPSTIAKIGKSAIKSGADMAVYSYVDQDINKYVGVPVENIGSNVAWNALVGAALGGVASSIGSAVTKIRRKNVNENLTPAIKEKISNDFADSNVEFNIEESTEPAVSVKIDGKESKILNSKLLGMFPVIRGLRSKNPMVKKITDAFFRHQYINVGESGISTPVESELVQWTGLKHDAWREIDKHLEEYFVGKKGSKKELRETFNRDLSFALISGDQSVDPTIERCAKALRSKMNIAMEEGLKYDIYDDLFDNVFDDEGNRLRKITKEDLNRKYYVWGSRNQRDLSYCPRKFDLDKIYSDPDGWESDIKGLIRKRHRYIAEEEVSKIFRDIDSTIKGISLDDIPTYEELEKKLIQKGDKKESVVKARRLPFSSTELFQWLEHDTAKLMDIYFSGTGYEVAQKRVLRELGYEKYQDVLEAVERERGDVVSKENIEEMEFLRLIPKLIRGSVSQEYGRLYSRTGNKNISNILGALRSLNIVTLLGRVAVSCIEDFALTASRRGLFNHVKDMMQSAFGKSFENMSKRELQRYGIACEALSGRVRSMISHGEETWDWPTKLTQKFMNATGLSAIDDFRATVISNDLINGLAEKIMKGEQFETRLNSKSLKEIKEAIDTYAKKTEHGIVDLNLSSWGFDAKRDFMSEVERHLRKELIQPGAGDVPIFAQTQLGKLALMFKGYEFGLTNNVILPLVSKGYSKEIAKLMAYGAGFAMLSTIIRGYIQNNPYDLTSDDFYQDVLSRMPLGLFGLGAEQLYHVGVERNIHMDSMNDIIYSLVKGGNANWLVRAGEAIQYAVNHATKPVKHSRRRRRRSANTPWSETQWRRVIGLLPFNNLVYLAPIYDFWALPEIMEKTGGKKRTTRIERANKEDGVKK